MLFNNLKRKSKVQILICTLLFISIVTKAQNLVPNYSFEQHTNCGSGAGGGGLLVGIVLLLVNFNIPMIMPAVLILVVECLVINLDRDGNIPGQGMLMQIFIFHIMMGEISDGIYKQN